MGQCLSAANAVQTLVTTQDGNQDVVLTRNDYELVRIGGVPLARCRRSRRRPPTPARQLRQHRALSRPNERFTRLWTLPPVQVIRASKDLEWILEAYLGAQGKGLHEKCTSVGRFLNPVRRPSPPPP